jgi:RNA polymerase sigma-70 factor (ECF subfamily)
MVLTTSMPIGLRDQALTHSPMGVRLEQSSLPAADAEARRLAAAVSRGDEAAFQEFFDRYHQRLLRLLLVLSRGDAVLAQETAQSVMLTAAAKLRSVETEAHLWHWLARVARQHLSKAWRQRKHEPAMVGLAELPDIAETAEPDAVLELGLDSALLALEAGDRQAIEWFYFDGLSQKEIAGRLATTPKAVSSRLERARSKLRGFLKQILSHET